jgi:hypothetical protein
LRRWCCRGCRGFGCSRAESNRRAGVAPMSPIAGDYRIFHSLELGFFEPTRGGRGKVRRPGSGLPGLLSLPCSSRISYPTKMRDKVVLAPPTRHGVSRSSRGPGTDSRRLIGVGFDRVEPGGLGRGPPARVSTIAVPRHQSPFDDDVLPRCQSLATHLRIISAAHEVAQDHGALQSPRITEHHSARALVATLTGETLHGSARGEAHVQRAVYAHAVPHERLPLLKELGHSDHRRFLYAARWRARRGAATLVAQAAGAGPALRIRDLQPFNRTDLARWTTSDQSKHDDRQRHAPVNRCRHSVSHFL